MTDGIRTLIHTHSGVDFILEQVDPYGFWKISAPKTIKTDILDGMYTSLEHARSAIESIDVKVSTVEKAPIVTPRPSKSALKD